MTQALPPTALPSAAEPLREGLRHGAAMLRRPRGGRPTPRHPAPAPQACFTDWALI